MTLQEKTNKSYKPALNNLKTEIASELGITNYDSIDKGNLTARQNGYVGGYMTKTLVDMAEKSLSGNMAGNMTGSMTGNMSSNMSGK